MALGMVPRDQILSTLRGVYVTNEGKPGDAEYERGFHTALIAMAVAFEVIDIDPAVVDSATAGNLLFGRPVLEGKNESCATR
jgi:hypothetical protein